MIFRTYRSARQRRPDIQVYVPRAKRLIGEQEKAASTSQQPNRLKGGCPVTDKNHKSKSNLEGLNKVAIFPSSSSLQCTAVENAKSNEMCVGRGVRRKGSANSLCGNLPTETFNVQIAEKVTMDFGNCENNMERPHIEERLCDLPISSSREQNSVNDITMLDGWSNSSLVDCKDNRLSTGQGFRRVDSKSSSSVSTPGSSGRSTPSSHVDSVGQTWDYFSEIKNATNGSCTRAKICEVVDENVSEIDKIEDPVHLCKPLEETVNSKKLDPNSTVKDCDIFNEVLDCSDIAEESKIEHDEEYKSIPNDFSLVNSEDNGKYNSDTEMKAGNEDRNNGECYGHKKENDQECRAQEIQNRKNRRIIRGNFVSDVLIISDQEPVPPPVSENDTNTEKTSPPNGNLIKKKKVKHKAESGSSPKVQSPEKQKSSSSQSTVRLNPDECTWDMMFDDDGECLDPKLMEEVSTNR